jgi:hypothetical protein
MRTVGPRQSSLALFGGCALLTTLLLLAPLVSANPLVAVKKVLVAPYSGTPTTIRDTLSQDCGTATLSHGPTFNLSSGVGKAVASATANTSSSCSFPDIANEGVATGWFGLSTSPLAVSSGNHTFKGTWHLQWTFDLDASGAGASPGNLQTGVSIDVYVEIVDVTQSAGVFYKEWTDAISRTGDASVHSVISKNVTLSVTASFNATQRYSIVTVVEFTAVAAIAEGALTGQSSASVNIATGGEKATLVSVTPP